MLRRTDSANPGALRYFSLDRQHVPSPFRIRRRAKEEALLPFLSRLRTLQQKAGPCSNEPARPILLRLFSVIAPFTRKITRTTNKHKQPPGERLSQLAPGSTGNNCIGSEKHATAVV